MDLLDLLEKRSANQTEQTDHLRVKAAEQGRIGKMFNLHVPVHFHIDKVLLTLQV